MVVRFSWLPPWTPSSTSIFGEVLRLKTEHIQLFIYIGLLARLTVTHEPLESGASHITWPKYTNTATSFTHRFFQLPPFYWEDFLDYDGSWGNTNSVSRMTEHAKDRIRTKQEVWKQVWKLAIIKAVFATPTQSATWQNTPKIKYELRNKVWSRYES